MIIIPEWPGFQIEISDDFWKLSETFWRLSNINEELRIICDVSRRLAPQDLPHDFPIPWCLFL